MKEKIKKVSALLALGLLALPCSAQSIENIRINEVLVKNENSYVDDYGQRNGWIELFNDGYSSINIAGCYLSVNPGDPNSTYKIPKNDPRTIIPPQGYVVFFADGKADKGTFYTNFTLDKTGQIYLFDASGRNATDSVIYDINTLQPDVSIGYMTFDQNEGLKWGDLPATTPGATNEVNEIIPRSEIFREHDPSGGIMAITAMSVVFSALLLLFLLFKAMGKILSRMEEKKNASAAPAGATTAGAAPVHKSGTVSSEVLAAIAVTIKLYEEDLHDKESEIITINRVARTYSPWSSKIYGINNQPIRKK